MLEEEAKAFIFGERSKFAPPGVVGGGDGALNKFSYEHQNEFKSPPLASKMVNISLSKGQAVRLETPGGGGYGKVYKRKIDSVLNDVKLEYISSALASSEYGVVINDEGEVDEGKTFASREKIRQTS